MKKYFKNCVAFVLGILMLFSISACSNENTDKEQQNDIGLSNENTDKEQQDDIGLSYVSGESEQNGIVYTVESAYWNHTMSSSNNGPWRDRWYLLIRIKIQNNTSKSFTPSKRDFAVYYQIPEIEVEVSDGLYEMLPTGNGGYSSSDIDYIKAGQTAYFSLLGNSFYENPTVKYTDKFYLSHKIQNELGYEYKTLNLGVLKEY